jgi:tetratricopeptide (TPR) repeat protein
MQSKPTLPSPPRPARSRVNLIKWALGCTGLGMLAFTGLTMVALIVTPIVFRSLDPEMQYKIVKRLPFMASFQPTQPYQYLPTIAATNANAIALLSTPLSTRPTGRVAVISAQSSGQSVGLAAGGQGGALPTEQTQATQNSHLPTPILATVTPLLGPVEASPTPVIAETPQPTPTFAPPTDVPTPTNIPVPRSFHSTNFHLVSQDWNSCGPANLTQALQYYGWKGDQKEAQSYLKPNREDRNVSPWQMVDFVNYKTGVKALWRVAGDMELVKKLVSQRFAIILEAGYEVPGQGWMGHYATITGFDDDNGVLYWLDTNQSDPNTAGVREKMADFDVRWQQFNRLYIVVYSKDREGELAGILGPDADLTYNAHHALSVARTEASAHPNNQYAWFNVGSSYTLLGQYKEAAYAFDQASSVGSGLPFRILWYQFTPYEAYYNVGNYGQVIALTQTSSSYVEETFYWRGLAEAALGKTAQAIEDFRRALKFNPNFTLAADKLAQVQNGNYTPPVIAQAK